MRLALIQANSTRQGAMPLNLLYLASYLRKHYADIDIKIFDMIPPAEEVLTFNPDMVGVGAMTLQYSVAYKFVAKLREIYKGTIVLGGIHITLEKKLPKFIDIGIMGEGEKPLLQLVKLFMEAGSIEKSRLSEIQRILYWDNDRLVETENSDYIEDLDEIPFPARDLVDMEYYLQPNNIFGTKVGRGTYIITSRGCAYNCEFCSTTQYWRKPRWHSAKYVVDEIEFLIKKYGIELLFIWDDNFASNLPRLREMADEIERRNIKIEMGACGRIDFFTDEVAELYKRIGIKFVTFGIETASQRLFSRLKQGNKMKIDEIKKRFLELNHMGFDLAASFIIGSPSETEEEIIETLNFVKEMPFKKFNICVATPFIGTIWWEIAKEQGIVPENPEWDFWDSFSMFTINKKRPIFLNTVSREKLVYYLEEFMLELKKRFFWDWQKNLVGRDEFQDKQF